MVHKNINTIKPQVAREHYFRSHYLSKARFISYGIQLQEIYKLNPNHIFEIGKGAGLVAQVLKQSGYRVTTIDFDLSLQPDVLANVTDIAFANNTFDIVACFEVLEHIPWKIVPKALQEIARITKAYALISLPDAQRTFHLHIPGLVRHQIFKFPLSRYKKHIFDGEHYWEINKQGYPLDKVIRCMREAGFHLEYTFRPWENSQHRFFRLHKTTA